MGNDWVSAAFVRDVVLHAAGLGVVPEELCARAGVEVELLASVEDQLPGETAERVWAAAVELTGDDDLGLRIGNATHVSSLGVVAPVVVHCPDLGAALGTLTRFGSILLSSAALDLAPARAGRSVIALHVLSADSYLTRSPRQPIECTLAALLALAKQLCGRRLPIVEVAFRHPAPRRVALHEEVFQSKVRFGRPLDRIVLASESLDWPVLLAAPRRLALHEQRARELVERSGLARGEKHRVRAAIAAMLHGEAPTLAAVAERLRVGTRSLQRSLREEGTSFRTLLDETRRDLALAHLASAETSIAQLARLLGFSESRAFHRSFKRWTGRTPRVRDAHGPETPGRAAD